MTLIDGKAVSEQVKREIAAEVADIVANGGKCPHLAAILVGHDGGSETYVAAKVKACEVCGFKSTLIRYESDVTEDELLAKVRELNADDDVDGFIVQLPLPKHISEQKVIETIDYRKDVDGFHPVNVGNMMIGRRSYLPCTPNGILYLLKRMQIQTNGKHAVIVGRSNIVGKPLAVLLTRKEYNATVTICHTGTQNIASYTKQADILIAAAGTPKIISADMIKPGAAVIDVGVNRIPDASKKSGFRLCGDVDFEAAISVASYITPVPRGVGPMTIAMLLQNTVEAAEQTLQQ